MTVRGPLDPGPDPSGPAAAGHRHPRCGRGLPMLLGILLALASVGCSGPVGDGDGSVLPGTDVSGAPDADGEGGTLRVALAKDPVSLDPRRVVDVEGELVARALFEPLVDVDANGRVLPAAAQRWDVSEDGRTWTFLLRPARYHDGTVVRAEDFVRAFERVADDAVPPRFRAHLLDGVAGWEATDGRTLVVRLEQARPSLLRTLTDLAFVPVPAVADRDPAGFEERPIGNGPFAMAEPRARGAFVRLVAVADHHRPPAVDAVVLQVYADDLTGERRWQDLERGALHVTTLTPETRGPAIAALGRAADPTRGPGVLQLTAAAVQTYAFDVSRPPFDDGLLRRAIAASIDRGALAAVALDGAAVPADRLLPPTVAPTEPDLAPCPHCRRDVALARALLADWQAADPEGRVPADRFTLVLTYPTSPLHATVAERVAADVEETLGFDVRLEARDLRTFVRAVEDGPPGAFRLGLRTSFDGPRGAADLLDPRFRPGTPDDWTRVALPGLAARLDEIGRDPAAQAEAIVTVEADLLDAAVVVPLLWPRLELAVSPRVGTFRVDATGRWWLPTVTLRSE